MKNSGSPRTNSNSNISLNDILTKIDAMPPNQVKVIKLKVKNIPVNNGGCNILYSKKQKQFHICQHADLHKETACGEWEDLIYCSTYEQAESTLEDIKNVALGYLD